MLTRALLFSPLAPSAAVSIELLCIHCRRGSQQLTRRGRSRRRNNFDSDRVVDVPSALIA